MNQPNKKCVNYCRVSSREQEETGYSLDSQKKLLHDYSVNKGLKIEKLFSVSESASGHKQREVFEEMLEKLKKGRIKVIVCEKVDRLTRNLRDAVRINEWINEDPEREVHFAKENWVLTRDSKSNGKFIWNIRVSVSQYYTDNLSEEVKKGQKEKIAQGWLPTRPPVGYMTIGEKGHKTHIPDPERAPLVKKMFDLYATGDYSLQRIHKTMCGLGLRARTGKIIPLSRMADLLSNPFYCGKIRWRGQITDGKQEKIITPEIFNAVQVTMKRKDVPKYSKHNYLFKGIMKCADCDGSVTWQMHKGWIYGYCNLYRGCPKRPAAREDLVDKEVVELLGRIRFKNSRIYEWAKVALEHGFKEKQGVQISSAKSLNQRLTQIEARFERLYDDKIDGQIQEDFYNAKFQRYSKEKEEILTQLAQHTDNGAENAELVRNLFELSQRAKDIYASSTDIEKKKLILRFIYKKIALKDQKALVTEYTDAFRFLVEIINFTNGSNTVLFEKMDPKKFEPSDFVSNKGKSGPERVAFNFVLRRQDSNL
jgi:DNA invertase Pin-like site-specific DNA recombinase